MLPSMQVTSPLQRAAWAQRAGQDALSKLDPGGEGGGRCFSDADSSGQAWPQGHRLTLPLCFYPHTPPPLQMAFLFPSLWAILSQGWGSRRLGVESEDGLRQGGLGVREKTIISLKHEGEHRLWWNPWRVPP